MLNPQHAAGTTLLRDGFRDDNVHFRELLTMESEPRLRRLHRAREAHCEEEESEPAAGGFYHSAARIKTTSPRADNSNVSPATSLLFNLLAGFVPLKDTATT